MLRRFLVMMCMPSFVSWAGTLAVIPVFQSVPLGTPVSVDITYSTIPPVVGSFDLDLAWNSTILSFSGISFGAGLGDPFADTIADSFLFDGLIDFFQVSFLTPPELTALQGSGPIILATLSFDTIGVGVSPLAWSGTPNFDLLVSDGAGGLISSSFVPGAVEVTAAVPEPATFLLLPGAIFAIGCFRCRRRAGMAAVAMMVASVPSGWSQADTVIDYAKKCYAEVGIVEADLPGPLVCTDGTKLKSFVDGVEAAAHFSSQCDNPAWLGSGIAGRQCYTDSYIQAMSKGVGAYKGANEDFLGALLCRHKLRDSAAATDFDDIAMILTNKKTGKTCWFQTTEGVISPPVVMPPIVASNDGRAVPAPHTAAATAFWRKPSINANDLCARCHDNGPWMNSQWLRSQFPQLRDQPGAKYENIGAQFAGWKTPNFIEIARKGLEDFAGLTAAEKSAREKAGECTKCHNISGRIQWGTTGSPPAPVLPAYNRNYDLWTNWTVGHAIPQATTATALEYKNRYWMPTAGRPATVLLHDKAYEKHLRELKSCMEKPAADRKADRGKATGCEDPVAALNLFPAGAGAVLSASINGAPPISSAVAVLPEEGTLNPENIITPGSDVTLSWTADATHHSCVIAATYPPGVTSQPSGGSELIGTASNWGLDQTTQRLGMLTVPGEYRIDMKCRDDMSTHLRFRIQPSPGMPADPALLRLMVSVNQSLRATSHDGVSGPSPNSTVSVRNSDSVELSWTAYNVQTGSCTVRQTVPPGSSWSGEVGSTVIEPFGAANRLFTMTCLGTDGVTHIVSSQVNVVTGLKCDINGDLKIDVDDIQLINAARNLPVPTTDLRDVDGDGRVTVLDSRTCTQRCTNALCK